MGRIQAIERVIREAREMCTRLPGHGRELRLALADLDVALEEDAKRRAETLAARGVDCAVCGERFLPLPDDFGCCSIRCRYADTKEGT